MPGTASAPARPSGCRAGRRSRRGGCRRRCRSAPAPAARALRNANSSRPSATASHSDCRNSGADLVAAAGAVELRHRRRHRHQHAHRHHHRQPEQRRADRHRGQRARCRGGRRSRCRRSRSARSTGGRPPAARRARGACALRAASACGDGFGHGVARCSHRCGGIQRWRVGSGAVAILASAPPSRRTQGDADAHAPSTARRTTDASDTPRHRPRRAAACENCGAPLLGPHCYACGQPVKGLVRHFSSIIGDFLDSVFNIDARVFRTIGPLFARAGLPVAGILRRPARALRHPGAPVRVPAASSRSSSPA